jgi:hypothetical protein
VPVKRAIFISYRRDDAEGEAGRLFDDLVRAYGDDSVFMDVSGIAPGSDFRKAIDENVASCGVFLTIIGPNWVNVSHPDGGRRLDDANDFVRLEVGSALARNIAVIPVLVHDARMPRPDQLPENIKDLAFRNSVEISHARWNSDVQLLIAALKQYVTATPATETQPVHATIPSQLPPPVAEPVQDGGKKRTGLLLGIAAAVLVAVAVIGFIAWHKSATGAANVTSNTSTQQSTASSPQGTPAPAYTAEQIVGTWGNPHVKNGADALMEVKIAGTGPEYRVEPFGACGQKKCNWGAQTLTFDGTKMEGLWSLENVPSETQKQRQATLLLIPSGVSLGVEVKNTFVDASGLQQHNTVKYAFVRVKGAE